MRMLTFLLFAASLALSARTSSQTITFSGKDVPLKKVFSAIEKQTGFFVLANRDLLATSRPVSFAVSNMPLLQFLDLLLIEQPFAYSLEGKTIVLSEKPFAVVPSDQQLSLALPLVSGIIYGPDRKIISGASVRVRGTSNGTSTNESGRFTLTNLADNAVLQISSVGFERMEIPLSGFASGSFPTLKGIKGSKGENGGLELEISLALAIDSLENVVIQSVSTGYQTIPKERATGSFTQIDNKILNQQVSTNILDRLETIANGYAFSREMSAKGQMTIRGLSTIQGVKDPLIILDNFPYNGSVDNINPNDVESITLLKDAAAASIWGSKAGNGVIIINTKKSAFNKPLQASFNANTSFTSAPDLMSIQTIKSSDFIDVEQMLFNNNYRFADTSSTSRLPFSPIYEILFKQRRGQLNAAEAQSQIDRYRGHDVRNDFLNDFYTSAINQQYALSLQGGSSNMNWRLSGGLDQNRSELDANYRRINLRFSNNFKLGNKLSVSTGLSFVSGNTKTGKPGYGDITTVRGRIPSYTFLSEPLSKDYREIYTDTAGAGKLLNWKYIPFDDYSYTENTTRLTSVMTNLGFTYQIATPISIEVSYQYERQQTDVSAFNDIKSYAARDLINRFSQLNRTTGLVTYKVPNAGFLNINNSLLEAHNARVQVNYQSDIHKNAVLTFIAGGEIRSQKTNTNAYRVYGYDDDLPNSAVVDYATTYPNFVTGSNSLIPMTSSIGSVTNRFVSVFANGSYTLMNRYTISGSARRDASNTFGVSTNDRWTPLWSSGLAWEISKENWFPNVGFAYFKLRATYGVSGNVDPSRSAVTTINYGGTSSFTLTPFATVDRFYNPDLRWEKSTMLNLGIDFRTRNRRISGSLEYFNKRGTDLYGTSLLDYTVGLATQSIIKNVASMQGNGVDFEINSVNTSGKFKWESQLILNYSTDKVTNYYLSSAQAGSYVGGGFTPFVGSPVFSVYAYRWGGLDPINGDPIGVVANAPSKNYAAMSSSQIADVSYMGRKLPDIYGSIGNTVSYKGFSLSVRLAYKFGYFFKRTSINYASLYATSLGHSDYERRWLKPGDELVTQVPSLVYPGVASRDAFYNSSEVLIEKGDHLRLQYISLQYSFPTNSINRMFKSLTVYTMANNIGILWRANKVGWDPNSQTDGVAKSTTLSVGVRCDF